MYDITARNLLFNLPMAHTVGADVAIVYGALQLLENTSDKTDGFFSATFEDIFIFTTLGKNKIMKSLDTLVELGLIDVAYKGMPRRMHLKINVDDNALSTLGSVIVEGESKMMTAIDERVSKIQEYYI